MKISSEDEKTEEKIVQNTCSFSIKYFDFDEKQPHIFKCTEEEKSNGLCLFHNSERIDEKEKNKKLEEKILDSEGKEKPLYLIGYELSKLTIKGSFKSPIYLTRSKIELLECSKSKILKADFSGAKIKNANFSKTVFNELDFIGSKSEGVIDFSEIQIKDKANFSETQFNEVNFKNSELNKVQFLGTKFKKANFALAKIKNSEFDGVSFDSANFIGSKIEQTRFFKNKFSDVTNFTGSSLTNTNFPQCEFNTLNLDHCNYHVGVFRRSKIKSINFSNSNLENLSFNKVNFRKNLLCQDSTMKNVSFSNSNFKGNCNFRNTEFKDELKFTNCNLTEADFTNSKFKGKIFFNNVFFETPQKIIFDLVDFSQVSFRGTDVANIQFSENVKWGGKDGFTIIDEELNKSSDRKDIESIIATYRSIRQNYQNRYRHEDADKFLEKEIALKKKYFGEETTIEYNEEIIKEKINDLSLTINNILNRLQNLENSLNNFSSTIEK